jgi:hypothetical protein
MSSNSNINTDLFGNVIIKDNDNVYVQKKQVVDLSSKIKTEYVLEIYCDDEKSQEDLYNELKERGHKIKVLTL